MYIAGGLLISCRFQNVEQHNLIIYFFLGSLAKSQNNQAT
jgi:hypothetical protein